MSKPHPTTAAASALIKSITQWKGGREGCHTCTRTSTEYMIAGNVTGRLNSLNSALVRVRPVACCPTYPAEEPASGV